MIRKSLTLLVNNQSASYTILLYSMHEIKSLHEALKHYSQFVT